MRFDDLAGLFDGLGARDLFADVQPYRAAQLFDLGGERGAALEEVDARRTAYQARRTPEPMRRGAAPGSGEAPPDSLGAIYRAGDGFAEIAYSVPVGP